MPAAPSGASRLSAAQPGTFATRPWSVTKTSGLPSPLGSQMTGALSRSAACDGAQPVDEPADVLGLVEVREIRLEQEIRGPQLREP